MKGKSEKNPVICLKGIGSNYWSEEKEEEEEEETLTPTKQNITKKIACHPQLFD